MKQVFRNFQSEWAKLRWILAVLLLGVNEMIILHYQVHKTGFNPWSLRFWYLPLVIIWPLGSSLSVYWGIARRYQNEARKEVLASWFCHGSQLAWIANLTIFACLSVFCS